MSWFRPRDLLDQTFEVGIILKGLDGVLEVLGGLLLLVLSPATIDQVVTSLTQHELSEDPNDFLATHLLKTAHGLTGAAVLFGAVYLLAHGMVKVILVAALLNNQLWAYPWTIAFLGVFIVYQLYRLSLNPSVGLTVLTIFDARRPSPSQSCSNLRMPVSLLPGRADCPALGPGGRWTPRHATRAPGASDRANEVGPTGSTAGRWPAEDRLDCGVSRSRADRRGAAARARCDHPDAECPGARHRLNWSPSPADRPYVEGNRELGSALRSPAEDC
jgi:uncharacterized membrane protein